MTNKNNKKKLIKKTDNKQKINKNKKLSNKQKRNFEIIGFICSILLLVFLLFVIVKISTNVKSESTKTMQTFNEAYTSDELNIIFYYDSNKTEDEEYEIQNRYLIDFKKSFKINYTEIDISKISEKNKNDINSKLGIAGTSPSIIIVKNEKVVATSEGFIESHNLLNLLKDVGLIDEDANYSQISNFKFINYKDYKKILKDKEINVIIVGKAACKYCMSAKPILNNISKAYKKEFKYLDLSDLSKDDVKAFFENIQKNGYDDESLKESGIFNTPTILLTKDGKIISYLSGYRELDYYIEYLKENKAIK